MTTTVARGAGRPAASARRAKHAQRNPLPPKAGAVQAAKEAIAEAVNGDAGLLKRSADKGDRFGETIKGAGWTTEVKAVPDTTVSATATAVRGDETIIIRWDAGVFNYEESGYLIGDRRVRVRNVSQARQFALRPAEAAAQELQRVAENKAWKRKEPRSAPSPRTQLSFDPATVAQDDLWDTLKGKTVKWHNRFRVEEEVARVSPNCSNYFRITGEGEERAVHFNAVEGGARAVRLSAIVTVGGSTRRTRRAA